MTAAAVLVTGAVAGAHLRQTVAPPSTPWSAALYATASDVRFGQGGAGDWTVIDVELTATEAPRRLTAVTLSGLGVAAGRSIDVPVPARVEHRPGTEARDRFRLLVPLACLSLDERYSGVLRLTVTVERSSGATVTSSTTVQNMDQLGTWCPPPDMAGQRGAPAVGQDFVGDPTHPLQATLRVSGLPQGALGLGDQLNTDLDVELVQPPPGDGTATVRLRRTGSCFLPATPVPLGVDLQLVDAGGRARAYFVRVGPQLARWYLDHPVSTC